MELHSPELYVIPFRPLYLAVGVSPPLAGDEGQIGSLEGAGEERTACGVESSSSIVSLPNLGANESGFGVKNDNRVRCLFPEGVLFLVLLGTDLSPFLGVLLSVAFGMLVVLYNRKGECWFLEFAEKRVACTR